MGGESETEMCAQKLVEYLRFLYHGPHPFFLPMTQENASGEPLSEDGSPSVPKQADASSEKEQIGTPMEIAQRLSDVRQLIHSLQQRERELGNALRATEAEEEAHHDSSHEIPERVIETIRERSPGIVLPAIIDFAESMVDERIDHYSGNAGLPREEYLRTKFENVDVRRSLVTIVSEHYIHSLLQQQMVRLEHGYIDDILCNAFQEKEPLGVTKKTTEAMHNAVFHIIYGFIHDSVSEFAQEESMDIDACCKQLLGFESFEDLTEDYMPKIWNELIDRMSSGDGVILVDVSTLRHNVVNQMNVSRGAKSFRDHFGEEIDLSSADGTPPSEPVPLDPAIQKHIDALLEERKVSRMGMKYHERLEGAEADMMRAVRPRVAGYDREGGRIDIAADIQLYRAIESKFMDWRKKVEMGVAVHNESVLMEGLVDFHRNGGHASVFSDKQVRFMIENGMIVFLEMALKNGSFATVGTVSSLSRTPYNYQVHNKDDAWNLRAAQIFPQYDFSDLTIPYEEHDKLRQKEAARKMVQICRSSVLPAMTGEFLVDAAEQDVPEAWRGKSLRRLGLAAFGKFITFKVAQKFGSQHVTFNIGTVKTPEDDGLRMGNKVSREHNSWIDAVSWKNKKTPLAGGILMYWTAYKGEITQGLEEFTRPGGILSGKGWDISAAERLCEEIFMHIQEDIAGGEHAPW